MGAAIDDSSELLGLNYKTTKCNSDEYAPMKYAPTGCKVNLQDNSRKCIASWEDTRLSNPPSTLRGTGINRWEWLCFDPQENVIGDLDRFPINYRMVAKDNHVPLIETPLEVTDRLKYIEVNQKDMLKKAKLGDSRSPYAPGQPQGYINYYRRCP